MDGGKRLVLNGTAAAFAALLIGASVAPASAADLGGDCCADLEERVAELEATTVRKGNKKMSLKISGRVNRALMWYDNGTDSDVVEGDNAHGGGTLVKFEGEGTLRPGTTVGFFVAVALRPGNLEKFGDTTQDGCDTDDDDEADAPGCDIPGEDVTAVDDASVYISDEKLGTLTIGTQGATDGAEAVDLSKALNGKADMSGWASDISFDGDLKVDDVFTRVDGVYGNGIGYSTPTFGGFTLSANWLTDDSWGIAGSYAQEFNGLRVAAAVGYSNRDENDEAGAGNDVDEFNTSASVHHVPSGLFVTASYGEQSSDNDDNLGTHWYVKGGVKKAFSDLGATNLYAEYGDVEEFEDDTNGQMWGVGIEQDLDAVASVVYLNYRNWAAETTSTGVEIGDVSSVIAGMRVNF